MTDFATVRAEVLAIIEKYAFDKNLVRQAKDESRIIADLKINSARIVDIILDIEDRYQIEVDDKSIEKMITVQNAVDIIISKSNA
jgi:acyl carrier protein